MRPSILEQAIFDWIAARRPMLAVQLAAVSIVKRERTDVGFFAELSAAGDQDWDQPPLDGPVIASPHLEQGGGSLLWLSQGIPRCLEIYAFGPSFPDRLDDFVLEDHEIQDA